MSGRKRLPLEVKRLKGTFRADRGNGVSIDPEPYLVEPAECIQGEALAEWNRVAPELYGLGLLTRLDRAALSAYCCCWAQWQDAERQLAASSALTKAVNGNIVPNPLIAIANKSKELCIKFAAEFGFTPASRSRVMRQKREKTDDEWAKFKKN